MEKSQIKYRQWQISTEKVSVSIQWFEKRRRSSWRRPLFMVFSNYNKTPLCSASSSPPRRQREKGLRISLRFSAGSDDAGDDNDNNDDTMRFLRRDAVLPLFSCYHCWDVFPLCLLEWKLDPFFSFPLVLSCHPMCAREVHPGIDERMRTFISDDVSRFHLKSSFQSELCFALVSCVCQTVLPKLFRFALYFDFPNNAIQ